MQWGVDGMLPANSGGWGPTMRPERMEPATPKQAVHRMRCTPQDTASGTHGAYSVNSLAHVHSTTHQGGDQLPELPGSTVLSNPAWCRTTQPAPQTGACSRQESWAQVAARGVAATQKKLAGVTGVVQNV